LLVVVFLTLFILDGVSGFAFVDAKEFQDEFARTFRSNVTAVVNTVVYSLPYLNPNRAALLAIGSVAATNEASPGLLHYFSIKECNSDVCSFSSHGTA
jgi:NAD(P)-dependent dehydrogenase (short-subunit alcohol dehydrogenase family)